MRFKPLLLLLICVLLPLSGALAAQKNYDCTGEIALCSINEDKVLASRGQAADVNYLEEDEFYSFTLHLTYNGQKPLKVKNLYVRVNGGEKIYWKLDTLEPGQAYRLHMSYAHMEKYRTPGEYKVEWFVNSKSILKSRLTFSAPSQWYSRFKMPTSGQIDLANQTATVRSPYLFGWLQLKNDFRYTEYSADFKADFLPKATYCALANMALDLSAFKKTYPDAHTEFAGLSLYAGFQRRWEETITIMSAWDIYYTDANGVKQTLRGKQIYPDKTYIGNGSFTGEGNGIQLLMPYQWEANHWYRMLLQCRPSQWGTTTIEQWVCDLETNVWTLMCRYDTGLPDTCFMGSSAFFLENFDPLYAGEVRTMEIANIRVRNAKTGKWQAVKSATLASDSGLPKYNGSYAYGADNSSFWMITSGHGGDWFGTNKVPANHKKFTVKKALSTSPY